MYSWFGSLGKKRISFWHHLFWGKNSKQKTRELLPGIKFSKQQESSMFEFRFMIWRLLLTKISWSLIFFIYQFNHGNTFIKCFAHQFCILHHKPPFLLLQQNAVALVFMNAVVAFGDRNMPKWNENEKKAKWKKYIIPMSRFADTNLHQKRVMVTIKERWNANRPGTMW